MNDKIMAITPENYKETVLKSDKPLVLDIYYEDCAPCIKLAPIFDKMADKFSDKITFAKMLRDESSEQFILDLDIKGCPTLMFFKDGQEVKERLKGFITFPDFKHAVTDAFGEII